MCDESELNQSYNTLLKYLLQIKYSSKNIFRLWDQSKRRAWYNRKP